MRPSRTPALRPIATWPRWARWARVTLIALGSVVAVMVALTLVLKALLPSDAELARRVEREASSRLGVPVTVTGVEWHLWPRPWVAAHGVRTEQPAPIVLGRIALWPDPMELVHRRFHLLRVEVQDSHLPRTSVRALQGRNGLENSKGQNPLPLDRLVVRNLTYVSWSGVGVPYDADVDFDADGFVRTARVSIPDASMPAEMHATREGDATRWQVRSVIAGGRFDGDIAIALTGDGHMALTGRMAPTNIDLEPALSAFRRKTPIGGHVGGTTLLRSEGKNAGELARHLHSTSELAVKEGRVLRFDLDKAVHSMGKEHAGQTRLDTLTARLDTQNTEEGMRATYTEIHATSGKYTARGEADLYHRQIEGKGTLDIVDGLLGVPFTVSGPSQHPKVSVPAGFFAGAAVGTAILPGIGTVIGARIGAVLGLAGKKTEVGASPPPSKTAPRNSPRSAPAGASQRAAAPASARPATQ